MAIQIADGFQLRVAKPLDDRQNVETVAQLDPTYGYEGQIVYVKDIKQFYTCYKDENGSLAYKVMETGNGGGGSASSEEQIKDWVSGSSYLEGDYIYHEGEIYRCLTSNSDVDFDEINWEQLTYGIDELSKEDVEGLLGLTEEEIEAMADLILDTEVRIDKTYSSSKIHADIQQCLEDSKTYTLEELEKVKIDDTLTTTDKTVVGAINEIKASVDGITVPTKTSDLTNDSNFITSIPSEYVTETELKAKGYLTSVPSTYALKTDIPTVPTKTSQLTNDSNYQTAEQVNSAVTTEIAKVVELTSKYAMSFNSSTGKLSITLK